MSWTIEMKSILLFAVLAGGTLFAADPVDEVSVRCHNGTFVGVREKETGIRIFKGIPYAVQPTGALRWKRVPLAEPCDGTFAAKAFGPSCLQSVKTGPVDAKAAAKMDERCLSLNVWSADPDGPASAPRTGRPVMVYIHGGDSAIGSSSHPSYDGRFFVERYPDIVMVTVNYRVNLLGFADFSRIADGAVHRKADFPDTGRLGFLDQQVAFEWVQRNIAGFGGDPKNVTIFGESAGGAFVSFHLANATSQGLFNRVIMMSGVPDFTLTPRGYAGRNQSEGLVRAMRRLLGKGADAAVTMDDLMALDKDGLLRLLTTETGLDLPPDLMSDLNTTVGNLYCRPMRDDVRGTVVSDSFAAFATNGLAGAKDLMIGTTEEENRAWGFFLAKAGYGDYKGAARDPLRAWYGGVQRERLDETLEWYGGESNSVLRALNLLPRETDAVDAAYPGIWRLSRLMTFLDFHVQNVRFAERYSAAQAGNGRTTYMYRFAQGVRIPAMPWLGACHGADIPYAFGNAGPGTLGTPDAALVARFSAAFAQFARTGNPNAEGRADWAPYGGAARRTTVVGPGDVLVRKDNPDGEIIDLLMPGYDRFQKARTSAVRRRAFRIEGSKNAERRTCNERTE